MASPVVNPFDAPLQSEVQDHQQAQATTVAASDNGNPFDEPLLSEKTEAAALANNKKNFDVAKALGGMHGGSYDIAFRDPQGQISRDTIKAEAAGGTAGDTLGLTAEFLPTIMGHVENLHKVVQLAKTLGYGAFGLKEAHDLYKSLTGSKK